MYPSDFIRAARSIALANVEGAEPADIAAKLYGDRLERRHLAAVQKDAADAMARDDFGSSTSRAAAEFCDSIRPLTVLGRLQNTLRAPFNTPLPFISVATQFEFVGERQPIPVVAPTFGTNVLLPRLKISGIVVTSTELLRDARIAESVLFRELRRGCVEAMDRRLLDPTSAAIANERPASITYGAPTADVSGAATASDMDAVAGELLAVLVAAGSSLQNVALVTSTRNCAALALMRDELGGTKAFPDVTAQGGLLAGLPLLGSGAAPADTLIAIDGSELLVADDGEASLATSTAATVDQDSAPSGVNRVSLFSTDSAALKIIRVVNWRLRNVGMAAYVSGFAPPLPAFTTGGLS